MRELALEGVFLGFCFAMVVASALRWRRETGVRRLDLPIWIGLSLIIGTDLARGVNAALDWH